MLLCIQYKHTTLKKTEELQTRQETLEHEN